MADNIHYIGLGKALSEVNNDEPDAEVISLFTRMLEDAKSGKIKSVAISGVSNLGEFLNASAGQGDLCKIIGALEILKFRLQKMNIGL